MEDERGANGVEVTIVTQEGVHGDLPFNANLHQAWDETLIDKTTWSWGGYVDRLEAGWLKTADMATVNAGTTIDWANDSHRLAIGLMKSVPANIVLDDAYRKAHLALLDQRARPCRPEAGDHAEHRLRRRPVSGAVTRELVTSLLAITLGAALRTAGGTRPGGRCLEIRHRDRPRLGARQDPGEGLSGGAAGAARAGQG